MKKAFIVISTIEISDKPLTYSPIRSVFSAEERFTQTIITIDTINRISGKDTIIYLVDSSQNWIAYETYFRQYPNIRFVSVKKEFPEIFEEVNFHPNKSRCESLITLNFLEKYQNELTNSDILIKICGRYFVDQSLDLSHLSKDKIYFKRAFEFAWQDWWNYDMVKEPNSSVLKQYCSIIFGWGIDQNNNIKQMYHNIANTLSKPEMYHYDLETLLYYSTRHLKDHIIETDWIINGWTAPTGHFTRQ